MCSLHIGFVIFCFMGTENMMLQCLKKNVIQSNDKCYSNLSFFVNLNC